MSLESKRIAFIGGGAMAEALAGGLIAAGAAPEHLRAADPDPARRRQLEQRLGIATTESNAEAVAGADLAVVAVKPDVVGAALAEVASLGDAAAAPLWISIAAGVPLARLEAALPPGARIVRAMPNTPALVREGATAIVANARADAADLALAQALFDSVGFTWQAPTEGLLDAVTGLSGSGPAYVFALLEALSDAGVAHGLPREASLALATRTVLGAARLALESERSPAELREQVSSPGGTTLAGLARLEAGGFRDALLEAVAAAARRSRELGSS